MDNKPSKGEYLETLLRSSKTVFSTKDAALLWNENDELIVTNRLKSYIRSGKLIRVRRGLYVKDKSYDRNELATKIFTPSYISFETVLGAAGITFQYYSQIFLASYKAMEIEIENQKYVFKKMRDSILTSSLGIESKGDYSVATSERAFLDTLYLNKNYYFDNLRPINWDKVREILPIYGGNKRMEREIKKLEKSAKS